MLEPKVTFSQEPKVTILPSTIELMVTEAEKFSQRLNLALDQAGFPPKGKGRQTAVGNAFKVSQKGARKWLEGEGMPDTKKIPDMARKLGVSGEWLLTGKGQMKTGDVELRPVKQGQRRIPVINYVQAGDPKTVVDDYAVGNGFDDIGIDADLEKDLGPYAFALVVEGASMLPDYEPSDIIIVDPDSAPIPGDDVVAKFDAEERATLKRYRPRGFDKNGHPVIELRPLNDDWPTQVMDAEHPGKIIGPVVEQRKRKRRGR